MKSKVAFVIAVTAFFAFMVSIMGIAPIQAADKTPTAKELWEKITKINPSLKDYTVPVRISLQAKYQFLNPKMNLTGTYYFKKPDKHKLKLDRASSLLDKYPKIFGWNMPKLDDFNSTVSAEKYNGRDCYLVTLTPKTISGDIQRERFWIDKETMTYPKHIYEYKKGGTITLDVEYRKDGDFLLFDKMNAAFNFPQEKLSATAKAGYGKYTVNSGLTDAFFEAK
jgi:outer membrane lipoprotein-sorting protein